MLTDSAQGPILTLEQQEATDRLRQAILHLRQEEKEVFLLRQNGDLTYEQIAEVRNSPVGTVKTQMRMRLAKTSQGAGLNYRLTGSSPGQRGRPP